MIAFVFRNWKLFLDILLVVAAIVAFTLWDPFHIFQNSQLKQTANVVTRVRDIAELVTAEYYGEVIASLKETKMEEAPVTNLDSLAKQLFIDMKQKLAFEGASSYSPRQEHKVIYQKFLALLGNKYLRRDLSRIYDEKTKAVDSRLATKIIKRFKRDLEDDIEEIKDDLKGDTLKKTLDRYKLEIPDYVANFSIFHASLTTKDNDAVYDQRENVVFIGRGWVKAGFDLSNFNENSFYFDKSAKILHVFGISPRILDKDINPWYIPEREIEGFELVDYSGKVSFKEAQTVKAYCKQKLQLQAEYAGIYKQAEVHGKEALKTFFGLLFDEPDLDIEFHEDRYEKFFNIVSADTLITIEEAFRIDTLYKNEITRVNALDKNSGTQSISKKQLAAFLANLKKLSFISKGYGFSYYSLLAARILKDSSYFSAYDRGQLMEQRDKLTTADSLQVTTASTKKDSLWFTSGHFMLEFNETIRLLRDRIQWQEDLLKITPPKNATVSNRIATIGDKQFYIRDTVASTKQWRVLPMEKVREKPLVLSDFQYDVRFIPVLSTELDKAEINLIWIGKPSNKVPDEIANAFKKSPVIYNDSLQLKRSAEFQILKELTIKVIEKKKSSKPFQDASKWFNDQLSKIRKSQIL